MVLLSLKFLNMPAVYVSLLSADNEVLLDPFLYLLKTFGDRQDFGREMNKHSYFQFNIFCSIIKSNPYCFYGKRFIFPVTRSKEARKGES